VPVLTPPVAPMLATLARELPRGPGWTYEPKWDGFRCLAFREGDKVDLRSRNGKALARYFPEVTEALRAVPDESFALDGELLAAGPGGAPDFGTLMARLHPAASRVARLAVETPGTLVAFDLLAAGGADLRRAPFAERRARLLELVGDGRAALRPTPATTDPAEAERWLDQPPGGALDGVVAKPSDLTYQPGKRAMVKVKREHTADCVVAGMRLAEGPVVSSLLLGLWDGGELRHVGVVQAFARAERARLAEALGRCAVPLAGHPWEHGFALEGGHVGRLAGAAGRWTPELSLDWVPLRPVLVAEVTYSQVDGVRFRHPALLLRWRPDRDAGDCLIDQLAPAGPPA
jgi:ATP-dependent DNA ligase